MSDAFAAVERGERFGYPGDLPLISVEIGGIASAARNERERPVFLASLSRRLSVERPTRTENVVVVICVQYSTARICSRTSRLRGDVARDLL
jgi:CMP-2-keto-3-deoxyoctulosonic acid synthetase